MRLDEMLEGLDEKGFEEWRMEKDKRKKLLSEKEVMDAIAKTVAEAVNAAYEEKSKSVAVLRAVAKMNDLLEKLFREEEPVEEPAEEPDAEKPELSALEELLFVHVNHAKVQYDNRCSAIKYGRFLELCDLLEDAGLEEEYDAWKEEKGYE
ncbi:hypothetical protein ACTNE0_02560 [Bacillota bacterium HCP3S3_E9]